MSQKPGIPKGTRDFTPEVLLKRNYIFDTIKRTFSRFGFAPIETPVMENLSTLTGKYGEEGDQLLFKVLNSGDFLKDLDRNETDYKKVTPKISEKGLRYDLTIPFARYVVMHRNDIVFPFKRYQIQPVWRADRPQKGRYREFYQCDADVIGSESLLYEAELLLIYDEVFTALQLPVRIKMNNRKILQGLAEVIGQPDKLTDITVAIDKLDKIGEEGVQKELQAREVSEQGIRQIMQYLKIPFTDLEAFMQSSEAGKKGIEEIREVQAFLAKTPLKNELAVDVTLARGLNYYTGCIFEVQALGVQMGSIGGGGRYDNLTGSFGMPGMSGVGISFGAERIYDVLEELQLFPDSSGAGVQLLFACFDKDAQFFAMPLLQKVRQAGINAEVYPEPVKMKKQLEYADRKKVNHVAIVGSDEMTTGVLTVKNLQSGEQQKLTIEALIDFLSGQ
ncbi:histidine--tRNA ligase [Rhodoflexus caldus]|uniref:histidine--tRNA ligase n=1 Tax=Rhodoflexus caldus TaxID=2891236 RepID=UPI00202A5CD1|nr:histidine--tRNA ligase [Rhodoflexus caldus]